MEARGDSKLINSIELAVIRLCPISARFPFADNNECTHTQVKLCDSSAMYYVWDIDIIISSFLNVNSIYTVWGDVAGSSPGRSPSRNDHGQVVHTHVPLFTKQYKLVPAQAGS